VTPLTAKCAKKKTSHPLLTPLASGARYDYTLTATAVNALYTVDSELITQPHGL